MMSEKSPHEELAPAVDFHERLATNWNSKYSGGIFEQRSKKIRQALADSVRNAELWVDAGCGTGTLSRIIVGLGGRVVGFDASPAMVQNAVFQSSKEISGGSVEFKVIQTIEKIPLENHSVDGIVCSSVLEYLESPRECILEFARIMRSGGILILTVPHRRSLLRVLQKLVFKLTSAMTNKPRPEYLHFSKNHFSKRELIQLVQDCGFEQSQIEFTSFWPSWLPFRYFGALCLFRGKRK
jgi:ubiquinone/menaquinone biosynthesis C-methylase UbiE